MILSTGPGQPARVVICHIEHGFERLRVAILGAADQVGERRIFDHGIECAILTPSCTKNAYSRARRKVLSAKCPCGADRGTVHTSNHSAASNRTISPRPTIAELPHANTA